MFDYTKLDGKNSNRVAKQEISRPRGFSGQTVMTIRECPHCKAKITADKIPANRPFHCPECQKIISLELFYARFQSLGCLIVLIVATLGLFLLGFGWPRSLFFAFIAALPVFVLGMKLLEKIRPRPARLVPYLCRTQTDFFQLAMFLDTLADAPVWTTEFEKKFLSFKSSSELDNDLEQAAIECTQNFKKELEGTSNADLSNSVGTSNLDYRRQELKAIACDLRLAENQSSQKKTR